MPRIRYEDMTPDEQDDWHDRPENDRRVREDNEWERKVPDHERRENHPNRQVHRERFEATSNYGEHWWDEPGRATSIGPDGKRMPI